MVSQKFYQIKIRNNDDIKNFSNELKKQLEKKKSNEIFELEATSMSSYYNDNIAENKVKLISPYQLTDEEMVKVIDMMIEHSSDYYLYQKELAKRKTQLENNIAQAEKEIQKYNKSKVNIFKKLKLCMIELFH